MSIWNVVMLSISLEAGTLSDDTSSPYSVGSDFLEITDPSVFKTKWQEAGCCHNETCIIHMDPSPPMLPANLSRSPPSASMFVYGQQFNHEDTRRLDDVGSSSTGTPSPPTGASSSTDLFRYQYEHAEHFFAEFRSTSFCTDISWSDDDQVICENEFVACNSRGFDVSGENGRQTYCDFALPEDDTEYPLVLVKVGRLVGIEAVAVFTNDDGSTTRCVTDEASNLNAAPDNVTRSNAYGVFAPSVDDAPATTTSTYYFSSTGESLNYMCRDTECSTVLTIDAVPRDVIQDGSIGGNPTDIEAISETRPTDETVTAAIRLRSGVISRNISSVDILWDTTYGAVFERVGTSPPFCTVSPYAINMQIRVNNTDTRGDSVDVTSRQVASPPPP